MRFNREIRVLVLGALALASGPTLLGMAPELHPADASAAWVIPATLAPSDAVSNSGFRVSITGLVPQEAIGLTRGHYPLVFQRFSFSVTRMDADLVPWFTQSWRGLIRQDTYRGGRDDRIQITRLERPTGTGEAITAQAFRVGTYVTASFNRAKLLQIPAKLKGFGNLDVVSVTLECRRDCDSAAKAAAQALDEIIDANTTDREQ